MWMNAIKARRGAATRVPSIPLRVTAGTKVLRKSAYSSAAPIISSTAYLR